MFLRRRGEARRPTPFTTPRRLWRTPRRRHTHIVRRCKLEFYILVQHIHTSFVANSRAHVPFFPFQKLFSHIAYNIQSRAESGPSGDAFYLGQAESGPSGDTIFRAESIQYSHYLGQAEMQSGRQSRARGGRADGQAERTADAEQSTRRQSGRPSGDASRLRGRGGRPVETSRVAAQRRSRSVRRLLSLAVNDSRGRFPTRRGHLGARAVDFPCLLLFPRARGRFPAGPRSFWRPSPTTGIWRPPDAIRA